MRKCFDSEKYLKLQKAEIKKRIGLFDKLYIEFGGKLVDDYHAARVLPGFEPDLKIRLLQEFKQDLEVILCINANDIETSKIRSDRVISYETEVIRLIEFLRSRDILINNVVITLFDNQPKVKEFVSRLKSYKIKPYIHTFTKGYPTDVNTIVSDKGYGANPYIKTEKSLVVVSAPGANSGKLATSLSQLYYEHKHGVKAGYAKLETFPVWDLPLKHPVNLAYEAATADIDDKNMIDYFHLEKYGQTAVNYNRDLETFPILKEILHKIAGKDIYYSPTDMGVNVIGKCITDDKIAKKAAENEILRRYFKALVDYKRGVVADSVPERIKLLMNELDISEKNRTVVARAEQKQIESHFPSACMQIGSRYVTGRKTGYLSPISSTILNALKMLTRIPDEVDLISENVLEPILLISNQTSNFKESYLKLDTVLVALSICLTTNPMVMKVLSNLEKLRGTELHATYMIPDNEMIVLNNLGVNVTCSTEVDL